MSDVFSLSLLEARDALARGDVSSAELTAAHECEGGGAR